MVDEWMYRDVYYTGMTRDGQRECVVGCCLSQYRRLPSDTIRKRRDTRPHTPPPPGQI